MMIILWRVSLCTGDVISYNWLLPASAVLYQPTPTHWQRIVVELRSPSPAMCYAVTTTRAFETTGAAETCGDIRTCFRVLLIARAGRYDGIGAKSDAAATTLLLRNWLINFLSGSDTRIDYVYTHMDWVRQIIVMNNCIIVAIARHSPVRYYSSS